MKTLTYTTKHLVFSFEKHLKHQGKYLGKVKNKRGQLLGMIDYHLLGRLEHVFEPEFDMQFSAEALGQIGDVLQMLNQGHFPETSIAERGMQK